MTVTTMTAPIVTPVSAVAQARQRRRRRQITDRIVVSTLVLIAIVLALYPVAGTFWNNYQAYRFAQHNQQAAKAVPVAEQTKQLAAARTYNTQLKTAMVTDPWNAAAPAVSADYQRYLRQLNATATMATIRIPTQKVMLPVGHGTAEDVLSRGAGHVYGTSLPVGGINTRTAISAHTALGQMTAFDRLEYVKAGDVFYIDVMGQTLAYRVTQIDRVLPAQVDAVKKVAGKDLATLITCTPYSINSHRLLVTGERIPYAAASDPRTLAEGFDWTIQPWMWFRVAVAGAALVFLLACAGVWVRGDLQRRRAAAPSVGGQA